MDLRAEAQAQAAKCLGAALGAERRWLTVVVASVSWAAEGKVGLGRSAEAASSPAGRVPRSRAIHHTRVARREMSRRSWGKDVVAVEGEVLGRQEGDHCPHDPLRGRDALAAASEAGMHRGVGRPPTGPTRRPSDNVGPRHCRRLLSPLENSLEILVVVVAVLLPLLFPLPRLRDSIRSLRIQMAEQVGVDPMVVGSMRTEAAVVRSAVQSPHHQNHQSMQVAAMADWH